MNEKPPSEEIVSENELSRLRQELEAAEAKLAKVKEGRNRAIEGLVAGGKDATHNFNDYLREVKQAEEEAIAALVAWGNAAAKFYKLGNQ